MEDIPRQLSLFDDPAFFETVDVEFKSAKGGVPGSLWETYSAFANTDGGTIYLGVAEKARGLDFHGVAAPDKVVDDLFSTANSNKVSCNLLTNASIEKIQFEGTPDVSIIRITVPRATRQQRPVYLNNDPLRQTFRRNHTGDYRCTEDEVRRLFADQSAISADARLLPDFSFDDLDQPSIRQFRQRAVSVRPEHPWHAEDDKGLLQKLGGWREDRNSKSEGLTVAGLLMFGRQDAVRAVEAFPNFQLDYRERSSDVTRERWTDRLSVDGSWEGNLFQFYLRVLPRISGTLKTPFQLDQEFFRYDESAVGIAVREAIVNAIIHADYAGQGGVVIDRFPNRMEFSNPGTLLVSHEQLLRGGVSECRNKALQAMFQFMGAGDKAGSGIDTIRKNWGSARLRAPSIAETSRPDRVRLELSLESILPEAAVSKLSNRFGGRLAELRPEEVQILVMALEEGSITNAKLQDVLTMHRTDLTALLQDLVRDGFLDRKGFGRWTTYELPALGKDAAEPSTARDGTNEGSTDGTLGNMPSAAINGEIQADVKRARPELWNRLLEIGQTARARRAMSTGELEAVVLRLCAIGGWLTRHELGELVGRSGSNLRDRTLAVMVSEGRLTMKFEAKNHPAQAYSAATRS